MCIYVCMAEYSYCSSERRQEEIGKSNTVRGFARPSYRVWQMFLYKYPVHKYEWVAWG